METQHINEMEELMTIKEYLTDIDVLYNAKSNILEKKIDKLHDRLDLMVAHIDNKLDRILAYIDKVESPQYQQALDNKEILINLLANAVITKLFAMFNNGQNQMQ